MSKSKTPKQAQEMPKQLALFSLDALTEPARVRHWRGTLYQGDNLAVFSDPRLFPSESVDLVYLDPPFNSKRAWSMLVQGRQKAAFSDKWKWGAASEQETEMLAGCRAVTAWLEVFAQLHKPRSGTLAYLVMMAARLLQLHRVLKLSGSLYLHCDDSAGHYLKVLLDAIFSPENFLGQIAWVRVTGGKSGVKRNFPRVYDTIFVYGKSAQCVAPRFKNGVLNGKTVRPSSHYSKERFASPPSMSAAMFNLKSDLWNDAKVKPIGSRSKERTGYPTQKPLALLERIIRASSNPGDTVLDPFMGAGTTIAAAEKLGRNWIGIDMGELSLTVTQERLRRLFRLEIGSGYDVWRSFASA